VYFTLVIVIYYKLKVVVILMPLIYLSLLSLL